MAISRAVLPVRGDPRAARGPIIHRIPSPYAIGPTTGSKSLVASSEDIEV